MDAAASDRPSSLHSPHLDQVDIAYRAVKVHGRVAHRQHGRCLLRVSIDERRFWLAGVMPAKGLGVTALMATGLTEEDATTILYEVQRYDLAGHIPVLVTEPGWKGERWSYLQCLLPIHNPPPYTRPV